MAVDIEEALILPLYYMERVGFNADREYLLKSQERMKQIILYERNKLCSLAGCPIKSGQHKLVKEVLTNKFNMDIVTTNKVELDRILTKLRKENPDNPVVEFISTLQLLRRLEKWYVVYLTRFIEMLTDDDKLYTTINQVGTVSGRVTSDFQQFPKQGVDYNGDIIFTPRQLVKVPDNEYNGIVYLDYSQIELRVQALYTILIGHPDKDLCRAYAPYECIQHENEWYLKENPDVKWEPLDVHGHTAKIAFNIDEAHPKYKECRNVGKTVNFAKNYGAQEACIAAMFPEFTVEQIRNINESYYTAFPGIREYHKYCMDIAKRQSHATNLFGIRYYNVSGHALINMLIQGSSAFLLKLKIIELYKYCKDNNIKSKFQMNIHDELSWIRHKDEPDETFFKFQQILECWEDAQIPIVAEMEFTKTTWADKNKVEGTTISW
jgi:DNA polymerase-1